MVLPPVKVGCKGCVGIGGEKGLGGDGKALYEAADEVEDILAPNLEGLAENDSCLGDVGCDVTVGEIIVTVCGTCVSKS